MHVFLNELLYSMYVLRLIVPRGTCCFAFSDWLYIDFSSHCTKLKKKKKDMQKPNSCQCRNTKGVLLVKCIYKMQHFTLSSKKIN